MAQPNRFAPDGGIDDGFGWPVFHCWAKAPRRKAYVLPGAERGSL